MVKRTVHIIIGIIVTIIIIGLFCFSTGRLTFNNLSRQFLNRNHIVFDVKIPDKLFFAGERVPLENVEIRERFERELLVNTYWHSNTLLYFKKAYRWFPVIEPILKQQGVPDDFKYLALIESGLTNAVSPSNAVGFWQFLENTGKNYGLEINKEVDERYHVEKSTIAACKYLKEAYNTFNKSWTLAAASYNMGIGGLQKQIERQKINNYYDLLLNQETSRFVFRILAAKSLFTHPTEYGFYIRKKDLYTIIPTYDVKVDTAITDLVDFAFKQNINYKVLKLFNPWLREDYLTNPSRKEYIIKIPKEGYMLYDRLYEKLLADTVFITEFKADTVMVDTIQK